MAHSYVQIGLQTITAKQVDKIREFLLNNKEWLWEEDSVAETWQDYCEWNDTLADRAHLIMPGELFICDLELGELWIGRNGRTKASKVAQLSDDMIRDYGNNFNGYAVLPQIG